MTSINIARVSILKKGDERNRTEPILPSIVYALAGMLMIPAVSASFGDGRERGHSTVGFDVEVVAILVCRGGLCRFRRLVEELDVHQLGRFPQQRLRQLLNPAYTRKRREIRIVCVQHLDLLQRSPAPCTMHHATTRSHRRHCTNVADVRVLHGKQTRSTMLCSNTVCALLQMVWGN